MLYFVSFFEGFTNCRIISKDHSFLFYGHHFNILFGIVIKAQIHHFKYTKRNLSWKELFHLISSCYYLHYVFYVKPPRIIILEIVKRGIITLKLIDFHTELFLKNQRVMFETNKKVLVFYVRKIHF